ncbi:transcriptional regulator [Tateyamaria omphalii]|uniref:winged helix-turn-helix transcriptional regulator n=1 Tax=Tateyamaria omphalii TaxID=299262 RepID=UPI00167528F7|nr:helix-turn-helix domain-containing protein [Tateyamaria omphalii]GGX66335.1 transcriptional regulator [Tateyamaria omphalii]
MSEALADPAQTRVAGEGACPAPRAIGMIGGKWKLLILQILIFQGTKRFGELRRSIDGITQTMLTNQLRALETDGLVTRKIYAEVPPRVEYSASADGMALAPVFTSMHDWWVNRSAGS